MKPRRFPLPLFLIPIILVLAVSVASAAGPVQATLAVDSQNLAVGEPILLTLEVIHPSTHQVLVPELGETWGPFRVVSLSEPVTVKNGDGTATTSIVIDARLFAPGFFSTPQLTVDLLSAAGAKSQVTAAPVTVQIASSLSSDDMQLHDLKPQASLPTTGIWLRVLGLILFLPVVFGVLYRVALRGAKNREHELLPADLALLELDRIAGLHLPQKGYVKEYCTLLAQCVRSYVEQEFAVPVAERTTAEIRVALEEVGVLPEVTQEFSHFLIMTDTVRFSQFSIDASTADYLMLVARKLFALEPLGKEAEQRGRAGEAETLESPEKQAKQMKRPVEVAV